MTHESHETYAIPSAAFTRIQRTTLRQSFNLIGSFRPIGTLLLGEVGFESCYITHPDAVFIRQKAVNILELSRSCDKATLLVVTYDLMLFLLPDKVFIKR